MDALSNTRKEYLYEDKFQKDQSDETFGMEANEEEEFQTMKR